MPNGTNTSREQKESNDSPATRSRSSPSSMNPGTRAEYSDIGFMLLGELLERVAGESLDSFCSREVFVPLGMGSTYFRPHPKLQKSIPPTRNDQDFRHRVIQGEVHDENASVMGDISGHAG